MCWRCTCPSGALYSDNNMVIEASLPHNQTYSLEMGNKHSFLDVKQKQTLSNERLSAIVTILQGKLKHTHTHHSLVLSWHAFRKQERIGKGSISTLEIGMWYCLHRVLIFNTSAMYFVKTNGRNGQPFHTERVLIFITPARHYTEKNLFAGLAKFSLD